MNNKAIIFLVILVLLFSCKDEKNKEIESSVLAFCFTNNSEVIDIRTEFSFTLNHDFHDGNIREIQELNMTGYLNTAIELIVLNMMKEQSLEDIMGLIDRNAVDNLFISRILESLETDEMFNEVTIHQIQMSYKY